MKVYLASPNNQTQAAALVEHGLPTLLSFASYDPWLDSYQAGFDRLLIDSGAYSELTGAATIDVDSYRDWSERWRGHADAIAGLDDIRGDYRRSLSNYERVPWSFPTFHLPSDPPGLLPDLVAMARERGGWLGIGLVPPRLQSYEAPIRSALEQIPDDVHVHLWAGRAFGFIRGLASVDSTNWWRDAMKLQAHPSTNHLNHGECLDIVCKRYVRESRVLAPPRDAPQRDLFTPPEPSPSPPTPRR